MNGESGSRTPEELTLLPCPFCGGEAVFEQCEGKADEYRWSVGCVTPMEYRPGIDFLCYGNQSMNTYPRKKDAAEAWNKRAKL